MKLFAESDTVLRDNLYQPRARNVAYLFPRSQNDIISVIGYDVVRANIAEIRKARYFSVLADAVSCHNVDNVEHMPLGLRFVDDPPIQNPAYHTGLFSVFIASLCRFTTSLNFLTLCYRSSSISARRTVSSANIRSCIVQLSKQTPPWNCALASRATIFRTILNNHGDRGHPCCTPYSTSKHSVSSSSNLTLGLILTSLVRGVFRDALL